MSLDSAFLLDFIAIFIRCGAMLMVSPLYAGAVPVNVRVLTSAVIALSLTPLLGSQLNFEVGSLVELGLLMGREVLFGLVIGMGMQFLVAAVQMAGAIADMQIGLGSAQLFNPQIGGQTSPLGQFKFWLSIVILLLTNAHHTMFAAFVQSFQLAGPPIGGDVSFVVAGANLLGQLLVLSVQISAPIVAVTVVVDVAAGLINRAVPQTQPFLLALPAKVGLGLLAMSFGLPALIVVVQRGVDITFAGVGRILGG
jgi:flagellar biosynthetic protein FliR